MKKNRRNWQASWRDTLLLLGEFRTPLVLFLVAILGGGFLYHAIARQNGEPLSSLSESIYQHTLVGIFPSQWRFSEKPIFAGFLFHHAPDRHRHPRADQFTSP